MADNTLQQIPKLAASLPDVERGIACKGTSLESTTFGVNKKVFLFVRSNHDPVELRLKLAASQTEAKQLAATDKRISIGANGWAKLAFSPTDPPALDLVQRWIAESYDAVAGTPKTPKTPAKRPAKSTTSRKPAGKQAGLRARKPAAATKSARTSKRSR